jgi:NTE family protein
MQMRPLLLAIIIGSCFISGLAEEPPPPSPSGVCLVLSGGGARGLAHIGVLRAMEERGLIPDCIIGNSAGAIVGALFCAGYSTDDIERMLNELDIPNLFNDFPDRRRLDYDEKKSSRVLAIGVEFRDSSIHLPRGILSGHKVLQELNLAFARIGVSHIHDFDRLPIRFRCVAADLKHGRLHVFRSGRLAMAVRASMSIPLVLDPVRMDGMVLVDGMVLNNVPVDVARDLGYEKIIAVNVTGSLPAEKKQLNSFVQILDESLTLARLEKDRRLLELASVVLQPDVLDYSLADLDSMGRLIEAGHGCATATMTELEALFETSGGRPERPRPWKYTQPLNAIGVRGAPPDQAPRILHKSSVRSGDRLSEENLKTSLENIYAMDRHRFVDIDLLYGEGFAQLDYIVEEKPKSTVSVSLHYDSDYEILGYGKYVHRDFLGTYHQLSFSVLTGQLDDIRLSLESPLPAAPLRLQTGLYFQGTPHEIKSDGRLLEVFREKHYGLSLGTLLSLGQTAGLYGAFHYEKIDTVSVGFFDEEDKHHNTFFRFGGGFDTLDKWQFPNRGIALDLYAEKGFRLWGSDLDYIKLKGTGDLYIPLTARNVLHLGAAAVYSRRIPNYLVEFVGGQNYMSQASIPLPGYDVDELYGKDLWRTELELRRQYPLRVPGIVDGAYVFLKYGVAGIRLPDQSQLLHVLDVPIQVFHGGGMGLALETSLGPVRLFFGAGERGRFNFSFSVGPDF